MGSCKRRAAAARVRQGGCRAAIAKMLRRDYIFPMIIVALTAAGLAALAAIALKNKAEREKAKLVPVRVRNRRR